MALDLFCYCSQMPADAEKVRSQAAAVLVQRFGDGLCHYQVKEADVGHREIAGEFGLRAASRFLISVNDKESIAPELATVVAVLKGQFGEGDILVLLNNESPMG